MPNSDDEPNVDAVLDTVLDLLEEARVAQLIDGPIDEVTGTFIANRENPKTFTEAEIIDSVAAFVARVYAHALPVPQVLSPAQARAEGVHLLELHYEGTQARGYDGALFDVAQYGGEGVAAVMASLAERLKAQERERHFLWVMFSQVVSLPWRARRRLVARLLERGGACFPGEILAMPPEQLVCLTGELIRKYASSVRALERVFAPSLWPSPKSPEGPTPF